MFEEKQRYKHFVGINKDAKFKPIRQRNGNLSGNLDRIADGGATTTYFD